MYFLTTGWELITQSPQAGNTPPYLAGSWKFSQRRPGSAEQLFFSSKKKKMKKCFQNRLRIMFLRTILNFANNCRWVPLAFKRIINSKEFDAAVCKYKFSILLIILNFFSSVFTKEDLQNIPEMGSDPTPGLGSFVISEQEVLKQLFSPNPNKACGPDQIPPWFLQTFAADNAPILTDIFQDSIDSGTVPHRWKEADVCAVFVSDKPVYQD